MGHSKRCHGGKSTQSMCVSCSKLPLCSWLFPMGSCSRTASRSYLRASGEERAAGKCARGSRKCQLQTHDIKCKQPLHTEVLSGWLPYHRAPPAIGVVIVREARVARGVGGVSGVVQAKQGVAAQLATTACTCAKSEDANLEEGAEGVIQTPIELPTEGAAGG
jgi:hypothetical protein